MCMATFCVPQRLHTTHVVTYVGLQPCNGMRIVDILGSIPRCECNIHRSTHAHAATSSHSMVTRWLLVVLVSCLAACAAGQGEPALQGLSMQRLLQHARSLWTALSCASMPHTKPVTLLKRPELAMHHSTAPGDGVQHVTARSALCVLQAV